MKRWGTMMLMILMLWVCAAAAALAAEGKLTIRSEHGKHSLAAGASTLMTASLDGQALTAEQIRWSIHAPNGASLDASQIRISARGNVRSSQSITQPIQAVITAETADGSRADYELLVYPPVKSIRILPSRPMAFVGGNPLVIKASTQPSGLGRTLTWKVGKSSVAKVQRNADGTISIIPRKAGTTYLTARSDSGVESRVLLTVTAPVTKVEIRGDDYVRRGEGMVLSSRVYPRLGTIWDVEWSLDVDASIATIDARGRLLPTGNCPVGTIITVTCRAKGTDQNVFATKEVIVTYPRQKLN